MEQLRERHTNLHSYDSTAVGVGSKREAFAQEGMMGEPSRIQCAIKRSAGQAMGKSQPLMSRQIPVPLSVV